MRKIFNWVLAATLARSRGQVIDLFTKKSKTCPSDLTVIIGKGSISPIGRRKVL